MTNNKDTYTSNPKLKRPGVTVEWTAERMAEYAKCVQDPVYFIKNYVKIISLDHGVVPFKMWDWQEELIENFVDERYVICKIGRQSGKCFDINTSVKLRRKSTGEVTEMTVGEFKSLCQEREDRLTGRVTRVDPPSPSPDTQSSTGSTSVLRSVLTSTSSHAAISYIQKVLTSWSARSVA